MFVSIRGVVKVLSGVGGDNALPTDLVICDNKCWRFQRRRPKIIFLGRGGGGEVVTARKSI